MHVLPRKWNAKCKTLDCVKLWFGHKGFGSCGWGGRGTRCRHLQCACTEGWAQDERLDTIILIRNSETLSLGFSSSAELLEPLAMF
jgi:hypothetical protein